jgi:hypothetical protein
MVLAGIWPWAPKTTLQWIILIALGPPLYILGEEFFGWLFSRKHGFAISPREFSFLRIGVGLVVCLAWLGLLSLLWWKALPR